MSRLRSLRIIPLPAWRPYRWADAPADLMAAIAVLFLAVPQGLAYATIAHLPPVMGLYAAAIPTIVGSLTRSSRHVICGPSNALSLLVGAAIVSHGAEDPMATALTLALMVGVLQIGAGVLRLGALVDFISSAVVLGYVTGAGVLIAIGQLYNLTGTDGPSGRIWVTVSGFVDQLDRTDAIAVAFAAGTVAVIVVLRFVAKRWGPKIPSAIVAMGGSLVINLALGLEDEGLRVVSDLGAIPSGLPGITLPAVDRWLELLPAAVACTVLSLVESSAVASTIASRTGQRIRPSTEFFGQGLANLSASLFGGYPISGSLARSALNERAGARTRFAGVITGSFVVIVLLSFGPILDHTPVASLAGLLLVVAYDLVDRRRIRRTLRASRADAAAFAATMVGTWIMSLDLAIYLGVGISLVLYLRRARLLSVRELVVDEEGLLREQELRPSDRDGKPGEDRCPRIRMLHVEGSLFFGAATELRTALEDAADDEDVRVVVLRLKRARGLDVTTADVLTAFAERLANEGRRLLLVGMTRDEMDVLEGSGAAAAIGAENLFPTRDRWFSALDAARARAVALCGSDCATCPLGRVQLRAAAARS